MSVEGVHRQRTRPGKRATGCKRVALATGKSQFLLHQLLNWAPAACRLVHDTDIVEFELKSKRFSLSVRKKEALQAEQAAAYQVGRGAQETHRGVWNRGRGVTAVLKRTGGE